MSANIAITFSIRETLLIDDPFDLSDADELMLLLLLFLPLFLIDDNESGEFDRIISLGCFGVLLAREFVREQWGDTPNEFFMSIDTHIEFRGRDGARERELWWNGEVTVEARN